jgi:tyrosine-protein kinase Etk/Wzc
LITTSDFVSQQTNDIVQPDHPLPAHAPREQEEGALLDLLVLVAENKRPLVLAPLIAGILTFGSGLLITPKFTSTGQILIPQQQQGTAAAILGSLGGLAGAGGAIAGLKNPADQWVGLMKSRTVADALLDRFKLVERYETDYRFQAREKLDSRSKISGGKDGLIDIEVEDEDPKTAAAMVNAYIDELKKLSDTLAVTEAAQRRVFFEKQLNQAKEALTRAEIALRSSGVSESILKTDPAAAVAGVAQLKAQITAAEVQIEVMKGRLTNESPELREAQRELTSLRQQLALAARSESPAQKGAGAEYVSLFRDFKYYETLFDMMARQYELAKADEAKQGASIQVVDAGNIPEWKSSPKRATMAVIGAFAGFLAALTYVLARNAINNIKGDGVRASKWQRLMRNVRIKRSPLQQR